MAKKPDKEPKVNPWDRRPWPKQGDKSDSLTYEAMGRALTAWEHHEAALSILFSMFVRNYNTRAGRRAYNAVRTFEGRAEMLRAASETYFLESPNADWQNEFKEIFRNAKGFAPRRNDIAHSIVGIFLTYPLGLEDTPPPWTYALYPSLAAYKDRSHDETPEYCYTSVELNYFSNTFLMLQTAPYKLAASILMKGTGRDALLPKPLLPDRE